MAFVFGNEMFPRREEVYKNPEHLTRQVRIKRTGKGFYASGRLIAMGETVTVDQGTAADLVYLQKATLVE